MNASTVTLMSQMPVGTPRGDERGRELGGSPVKEGGGGAKKPELERFETAMEGL